MSTVSRSGFQQSAAWPTGVDTTMPSTVRWTLAAGCSGRRPNEP
ncbi:hypothetical protein ABZT04_34335 [Streptomyces sp. NPDC005492]